MLGPQTMAPWWVMLADCGLSLGMISETYIAARVEALLLGSGHGGGGQREEGGECELHLVDEDVWAKSGSG